MHAIVIFEARVEQSPAPTLSAKAYNRLSGGEGKTLWQRGFFERVIRDEAEYQEFWRYIDENPKKWDEDRYYMG